MYNRRYDRKTIILKQETESFSKQSGLTAMCVVEIKNGRGKLIIKGNIPDFYHIYLIAGDEGGNIVYNAGNGHEVHFDADNVGQSGQRIENFDVFVVGGRRDDGQFLSECYVGYAGKRREWRQKAKPDYTKAPEKEKPAGHVEKKPAEAPKAVPEEKAVPAPETDSLEEIMKTVPKEKIIAWGVGQEGKKDKPETAEAAAKEKDPGDTFKKIVKNFSAQMKKLETMGVLSPSEVAGINKPADEAAFEKKQAVLEEEPKEEKEPANNAGGFGKYADEIFENNPPMEPFANDCFQWVRSCPEELWPLPEIESRLITSSFVVCADKKYSHIMLGRGEGSLLLAVPGIFSQSAKKTAESLGFMDFRRNKGNRDGDMCYGYWIRKINK